MGEMSDLYESDGVETTAPVSGEEAGGSGGGDMERMRRAALGLLATVAVTAGAALALAGPAAAELPAAPVVAEPAPGAPDPGAADPAADVAPDPSTACATAAAGGYAPTGRCELALLRAEALCVGDTPVLDYAVQPYGTPNTTVTLTWVDPAGRSQVQSGLPLSGRVNWPGTVVQDGRTVDWPGWTQNADGTWTEGDEFDYTRPSVTIEFEVNPSVSTVVAYPPPTSACANPPAASRVAATVRTTSQVLAAPDSVPGVRSAVLAATGANAWPLLAGAGAAVLLGSALVTLSVRRVHRGR